MRKYGNRCGLNAHSSANSCGFIFQPDVFASLRYLTAVFSLAPPPLPTLPALRQAALLLLGRREYSAKELADKLAERFSISPKADEILAVISTFQAEKYQSDERFTEMLVRSRRLRGHGPLRIEQELRTRGIDADLVAAHVERGDKSWSELARTIKQKRFGGAVPTSMKDKARIARFLQGRGFLSEHIAKALR